MSVLKIKAFRVTEAALKAGRMPSYNEMCDNVQEMIPVAMRNIPNYDYHVLEDVKGNVYLIKDKYVVQNLLDKRNMGEVKSDYFKPKEKTEVPKQLTDTLEEVENDGEENE